jgi:hypothetical protein
MNDSFHQIGLSENSSKYTAFVTPSGRLMEYTAIPHGLNISTSAFQRALNLVIAGMKYSACASFVDDIVISGETFQINNQR